LEIPLKAVCVRQIYHRLPVNHGRIVAAAFILQTEMPVRVSIPGPERVTLIIELDNGVHQDVSSIDLPHVTP
jgi:hypothetical protein